MQHRPIPRKRAVNVFLSVDLVDDAKAMGLNLSELFERELACLVRAERSRRWKEENRAAIEAQNAFHRKHGFWAEGSRPW